MIPQVRAHEIIDYKRCPKKWYWNWRLGLAPKTIKFGALEFGTWMHEALAQWYSGKQNIKLGALLDFVAALYITKAMESKAPAHEIEKAEELAALGMAMGNAYTEYYAGDPDVQPVAIEEPIDFEITSVDGSLLAVHKLKPDMLYRRQSTGDLWLMEHKTAASIRLEHLVLDDQARPYAVLAERAYKKAGILSRDDEIKGVMYNFLRKALPDERPQNYKGQYLNKNGTVSKSQPPAYFVRHPIEMTRKAKLLALKRIRRDTTIVARMAEAIRSKEIKGADLPKTPHNSCPKTCQYFTMCVVEEQGGDIRDMQRNMFVKRDPYEYDEETTADRPSFEMG